MSTTPTLPETTQKHPDDIQPPEESVWKRYSPHNELPLSGAGSFALHALGIGLIVLIGFTASLFGFNKSKQSLPVEPVRLQKFGGGGGHKQGVGDGPGIGDPGPEKVDNTGSETTDPDIVVDARPRLDPGRIAEIPSIVQNNPDIKQYINKGHPNVQNLFDKLASNANKKLREGVRHGPVPGKGKGGTGSGGGEGTGVGTGKGSDEGSGEAASLSRREKRMLRWTMIFDTDPRLRGHDYLQKLRGLGAILGIPTPDGSDYRIVRDFTPPVRLLKEDLSKLERIYWRDYSPQNCRDIAMQLRLPYVPKHFVAFMPQELEAKLFDLERAYRGLDEDQIFETKFKIRQTASGTQPYVVSQKAK